MDTRATIHDPQAEQVQHDADNDGGNSDNGDAANDMTMPRRKRLIFI